MALPTLQELLEAGVHFGHDPSRWNPKMAPHIFATRERVHVIDLQQTLEGIERAIVFVRGLAARGGVLLFVATKRQARSIVKTEAERCGMPYVTTRWLGGTLTNFPTIMKSIEKRAELSARLASPESALLTKKDRQKMAKEIARLGSVLEGLRLVKNIPDALFLVGSHGEKLALKEAQRTKVPVVAVVDTNADPSDVTYPIPGNDDAVRAIQLLTKVVADAVIEGRQLAAFEQKPVQSETKEPPAPAPTADLPPPSTEPTPVRAGGESPTL